MLETNDIVYICNHGLIVKVVRDEESMGRLILNLFDFEVLDRIDDALERLWVAEAINNFILRFSFDMNLGELLDEYLFHPIGNGLMLQLENIIENKIYEYENFNGMAFSKLLAIHIANHVHGRVLELETGHTK
ncbi:hypothetical protein [Bacillus phage SWEP1]|nr:hypothetical protein [Bacillus phage SWEP1]